MTDVRQNIFSSEEPAKPSEQESVKGKEKYLREAGKIEDYPEDEEEEVGGLTKEQIYPVNRDREGQAEHLEEGHSKEWLDRARVQQTDETDIAPSPRQSNAAEEDVEEKSAEVKKGNRYY